MRAIILFLILFASKSFAQQHLYTLNDGVYLSEGEFKSLVDSIKKDPYSSNLRFVIYHKARTKDTVINYYSPAVLVGHTPVRAAKSAFKVVFKQDATFLLLNKKLPHFRLKSTDGKMLTSNALLGKPTLLSFWATDCRLCMAELPELVNLHHQYKNQVNFVAITTGKLAGTGLSKLVKDAKVDFSVLINGDAYQKAIKISATPRYLFIDKNGIVKNIQYYYSVNENAHPMAATDPSNYFVRLLNTLLK